MSALQTKSGAIIGASLFTLVMVIIACGLGIWQIERLAWKEGLIATLNDRLSRPPQDMPPRADWGTVTQERAEFRRVTLPLEYIPGEEALVYTAGSALRPDARAPGYWVFAPARLPGGTIVLVNRGFAPLDRKDPASRTPPPPGVEDAVGYLRWPEERGMFTPADDIAANVWYLRDIKAMAAARKWQATAPFYIDLEGPVPAGGVPLPGPLQVRLPNNHLQYAITWFGLALAAFAVYVAWIVSRLRQRV